MLYTFLVYARCMSRTNIDLDDELVADVMRRHALTTKKEAVEFALRKAARRVTTEDIDAMRGIGWDGDLERMRNGTNPEYKWS